MLPGLVVLPAFGIWAALVLSAGCGDGGLTMLLGAVAQALALDGPVLLDVLTNPEEIALPSKTTPSDAWGFAIAKMKEGLVSTGDEG